jgi:hypothetical protein
MIRVKVEELAAKLYYWSELWSLNTYHSKFSARLPIKRIQ